MQISPIFLWGMYSTPAIEKSKFEFFEYSVNGKVLNFSNTYNDFKRQMNYYPTLHFLEEMNDEYNPQKKGLQETLKKVIPNYNYFEKFIYKKPKNTIAFANWQKEYLLNTSYNEVNNLALYHYSASFNNNFDVVVIKKDTIFKIDYTKF